MRKILVLRGGALGDFIVTLPMLALLRARWPAAEITLIGNAPAAALARARGLVHEVLSQNESRWSALYGTTPLPRPLATWLESFDLVVNFWPDPSVELRRHFPVRPGQTFLAGDAAPTVGPAARHYCAPLQALGLEPGSFQARLTPLAAQQSDSRERRAIAIHPGSGSPRKNWPAERWLEVIRALNGPALVILGEAEIETWRDRMAALPGHVRCAVHRPLEELVTELNRCRLFLGHDSGISHLAAACGAPSLLLFGRTDPAVWAPPGRGIRVLRREAGLDLISVPEFSRELERALAEHK